MHLSVHSNLYYATLPVSTYFKQPSSHQWKVTFNVLNHESRILHQLNFEYWMCKIWHDNWDSKHCLLTFCPLSAILFFSAKVAVSDWHPNPTCWDVQSSCGTCFESMANAETETTCVVSGRAIISYDVSFSTNSMLKLVQKHTSLVTG